MRDGTKGSFLEIFIKNHLLKTHMKDIYSIIGFVFILNLVLDKVLNTVVITLWN
jgi:hypothetical protein